MPREHNIWTGRFYKRPSDSGDDYEVVLHPARDIEACKGELRTQKIPIREEATIGHFIIHLDEPADWAKVGSVIAGAIFGEDEVPR